MEEVLARIFQFSIALFGAFTVALWFALVVWTYRDAVARSRNSAMQIFSTLIVVLFFIPGTVIYLLLRPRETLDEKQQRWIEEEYLAQELDDVSVCPSCNHTVRDEWIYCPDCRYQLRRPCTACGRLVESGWEICAFCGADLRGSHEHRPAYQMVDAVSERSLPVSRGNRSGAGGGDDQPTVHTTADGSAIMIDADVASSNGFEPGFTDIDEVETGEFAVAEEEPVPETDPKRPEA